MTFLDQLRARCPLVDPEVVDVMAKVYPRADRVAREEILYYLDRLEQRAEVAQFGARRSMSPPSGALPPAS